MLKGVFLQSGVENKENLQQATGVRTKLLSLQHGPCCHPPDGSVWLLFHFAEYYSTGQFSASAEWPTGWRRSSTVSDQRSRSNLRLPPKTVFDCRHCALRISSQITDCALSITTTFIRRSRLDCSSFLTTTTTLSSIHLPPLRHPSQPYHHSTYIHDINHPYPQPHHRTLFIPFHHLPVDDEETSPTSDCNRDVGRGQPNVVASSSPISVFSSSTYLNGGLLLSLLVSSSSHISSIYTIFLLLFPFFASVRCDLNKQKQNKKPYDSKIHNGRSVHFTF